ncbi:fungal specific transcription factor domain-containing protein [Colletotrichum truncatum]|uniref:Fungal specific transcription factor domain-containing protein n=1 Tax=Colletotrichum truncatum TaxID=5467 RepID=A0ACC3YUN3_COLTU|nr:fungal specific transcription factor domain-containing protein [Colletotrichum truncatum]KAF6798371.1 fungal specific transcription factor domain-containing protein [Colletotrichum truncatum]
MVYYGALSKGCQRCRKRKVKCDQRQPGCLKCEKGKKPCPGYRDLADVLFRDERQRIKNRFYEKLHTERGVTPAANLQLCATHFTTMTEVHTPEHPTPSSVEIPLTQPLEDRAANFFFAYYTTTGPPFCDTYQAWLAQAYLQESHSNLVRATIQAVGMAAISNVFNAPDVVLKAKDRYCQALKATNLALRDPYQTTEDSTLIAILLLGLFETVTFENSRSYHTWASHIEGATALLHLRGQDQFSRELGIQLYIQFRNQILQACMQRGSRVPPALVEVTAEFENSKFGKHYNSMRAGSLALVGFRIVNIRAEIKNQRILDPDKVWQLALDINDDLHSWAILQTKRAYYQTEAVENSTGKYFNGKRHIYTSEWGAQVWNNWRSMMILNSQVILDYVDKQRFGDDFGKEMMRSDIISTIQSLSEEICISTSNLSGSPRASSMIWPLYIVSQEEVNSAEVRSWAADQLHGIKISLGIKQAAVLADDACPNWRELELMSSFSSQPLNMPSNFPQ